MDLITRQSLEKIKHDDEIIYEVFKSKKSKGRLNFLGIIVDLLFDFLPFEVNNREVVYLLASTKRGRIIDVYNGNISSIVEVPRWTSDKKDNFKKVTIDNYIYKKFKKIAS